MGTFDRRRPDSNSDRSPLRNLLDFESVNNTAKNAGSKISVAFDGLAKLFGLTDILDIIDGSADGSFNIAGAILNFGTTVLKPLGLFADLIGGFISSFQIPILDPTQILNLPALFTKVGAGFAGIFDGWFGGGGAGTPEEAHQTIVAIKDAIVGEWTIHTFTTSNPAWTWPAGVTVAKGIVIGGGGRGGGGQGGLGTRLGGAPGKSGGYYSQDLDPTGIVAGTTQLAITVGAAGVNVGDDGATSSIKVAGGGATLLESEPNVVGIVEQFRPIFTEAGPARGGRGGSASTSPSGDNGENGEDSTAIGGVGGAGGTGNGTGGAGTAGGGGDVVDPIKRGGAGI